MVTLLNPLLPCDTIFVRISNKAKAPPGHSGPYVIAFDPDTASRGKRRNDRKKSLMVKARELAIISGGEILVHFYHYKLRNKTWAFASSAEMWNMYDTVGVKRDSHTIRCNDNGLAFQTQPIYPTTTIPSSQSSTGTICPTQDQSQSSSSAIHTPPTVSIAPQATSSASPTATISPTTQAAITIIRFHKNISIIPKVFQQ